MWANAVEEILRLDSPVQLTARVARNDVEVAGTTIRRGELVVVYLAAANRDPAVFPDPHRFDIERPNAGKHLAFSGGRHFCLGAALARAEGEVGLRTFFDRFLMCAPPEPEAGGRRGCYGVGRRCRCAWDRPARWRCPRTDIAPASPTSAATHLRLRWRGSAVRCR